MKYKLLLILIKKNKLSKRLLANRRYMMMVNKTIKYKNNKIQSQQIVK